MVLFDSRMPTDLVHYPDCAADCERLAEMEGELKEVKAERDASQYNFGVLCQAHNDLAEERDTWAVVAEMLLWHSEPVFQFEHGYETGPASETIEARNARWDITNLAAAYAIAELRENWREKMEERDGQDL